MIPSVHRPGSPEARVFREPWEAHVLAMAVSLREAGLFTWSEWTAAWAAAMRADPAARPCGEVAYEVWLSALEGMLVGKAMTD